MFAGKTQALMARLQSKQRAHNNVLVVKPALDNRADPLVEIVVDQQTLQRFESHGPLAPCPPGPLPVGRKDGMGQLAIALGHRRAVPGSGVRRGVWEGEAKVGGGGGGGWTGWTGFCVLPPRLTRPPCLPCPF